MERVKRQATLATNQTGTLHWPRQFYFYRKGSTASFALYRFKSANFKLSQVTLHHDYSDDEKISSLLSAVHESLMASKGDNFIELQVIYDESAKMVARMQLDETVVKTLKNYMTEPKISIRGTFRDSYPFYVPEINVSTRTSTTNFEGASEILAYLEKCTSMWPYTIKYSIFVDWSEITERKTQEYAVLDLLYSEKFFTDCCIITAEEKEVKCHRNILAASSYVIRNMLTHDMQESETNRIEMKDINEEVVNLLLAFIYGRAINTKDMKEEIAFDLLRTAHKYNITSLEELMTVTLFHRPNDSFNMNTVLDLFFFTMNVDDLNLLHEKMLHILKNSPRKLLGSSVYQDLLKKSPEEANKLALKLLELVVDEPSTRALPSI